MNQFSPKDRALRSKIRMQLAELIQKQKMLKLNGATKSEMEEAEGEIDVLRKELQSIEDSGHTVFISAKQMLEPKKQLSQKEKKISWKKKHIEIRLSSLSKDLSDEKCSPEQKGKIENKISKFQKELSDLEQEMRSVKELNHTRFLDSQNLKDENSTQQNKFEEVNGKIQETKNKISKAQADRNSTKVNLLKEQLNHLELEKEAIENFTHDEFLENLSVMKAKRRSQLR